MRKRQTTISAMQLQRISNSQLSLPIIESGRSPFIPFPPSDVACPALTRADAMTADKQQMQNNQTQHTHTHTHHTPTHINQHTYCNTDHTLYHNNNHCHTLTQYSQSTLTTHSDPVQHTHIHSTYIHTNIHPIHTKHNQYQKQQLHEQHPSFFAAGA